MKNNQPNIQQTPQPQVYARFEEDEIDLRELFWILWAEKWLIIGVSALFAIGSVIYALIQTDIYRAEAVLAPAEGQQISGAGQFAGAAALLGVSLGGEGGTISNALATLQSRQFLGRFISENELSIPLFAGRWNKEEKTGFIDESVYNPISGEWMSENGQPSQYDTFRAFSSILSVSQNDGLFTIAISWHNPLEAADWANKIVAAINREIRSQDVSEANSAIAYLRKQLESTQLVDMQRVFYQLIESQTRITMLADVREEYVFRIIDPAIAPDQRIAPNRVMICIIGTLAGVLFALMIIILQRMLIGSRAASDKQQ